MSVIKKETHIIKPTQPTQHSPIVLSNNDLVQPKLFVLMHYFFKNVNNEKNFMDVHKLCASLEVILSDYYPLAGQFKMEPEGRMSIVCNDQGVPFIVAESPDIKIQDLEEKNWANSSIPNDLLPFNQIPDSFDIPLFAAQHTTLADGSVVLGVAMHHSVSDGYGFFTFLENWGLKARQKQFPSPIHDRTLLKASGNPPTQEHHEFMTIDSTKIGSQAHVPIFFRTKGDKPSTLPPPMSKNIFYFSKDSLKKLRDDYSSKNSNDPWVSTNDVLVAHIWRTVTRARGIPLDTKVSCAFALDGRKRLNPPLPPNYFGNVVL
jgi:shikimate O-hydroxycinnamoyltransferase